MVNDGDRVVSVVPMCGCQWVTVVTVVPVRVTSSVGDSGAIGEQGQYHSHRTTDSRKKDVEAIGIRIGRNFPEHKHTLNNCCSFDDRAVLEVVATGCFSFPLETTFRSALDNVG